MNSSSDTAKAPKMDVHFSKHTGAAYVDIRQVIESEIARIREEYSKKRKDVRTPGDSHTDSQGDRK